MASVAFVPYSGPTGGVLGHASAQRAPGKKASLESAGALEGLKLAKAALTEVAETMASNARLVQAAAESTRLSEPSLFSSLGGFSHVTIDALSLISSFWPLARPSLQQMLL